MPHASNPAAVAIGPDRGVFESDAAPGSLALVVYVNGVRRARVELASDGDRDEAIVFLWKLLTQHDRHLRLVD